MRDGAPETDRNLRIWQRIGRRNGARAISLRVMEFGPGVSPDIRNGDCDEILFVLSGEFAEDEPAPAPSGRFRIDDHDYAIEPDTGIYVRPFQTFSINNTGPDPILIVSSRCPEPSDGSVSTAESRSAEPNARPPLVRLADRRAQSTADRWYRVIVDDGVGSVNATQFVGSIPPGRAPDHFHHYEEVLFILRGEGRMWAGDTNTSIAAGSCIYLPKGQVHCVENTGTSELRLLGVFYPAGSPSVRYDA
jgi:mannose-6-phosphate isomerase-like protein (cupin superfamily)